jgi:3-hydroxyacyl-CoA dehydrogenase
MKRARGVVKQNAGASLIDLGDGVLCVEFHSKMNSLGEDTSPCCTPDWRTGKNFDAMVIANQGEDFSVGAEPDDGAAGRAGRRMGRAERRHQPLPASQHGAEVCGEAGGGGAVCADAGRRLRDPAALRAVQASAELYMGLVEVGVGLIPAGGGCKELLLR